MSYPILSAVLNNCPLHAITPELKKEIIKFQTVTYNNGHNADYELLKNKFAIFYGIAADTFTWNEFSDLLKKYNEFDTQIIMGPVLREFMKDKMLNDEFVHMVAATQNITPEQQICNMTEINPNTGRYESLSPDVVFSYVGQHLGLSIQYFKNNTGGIAKAAHPIATVKMYHQGGLDGAQSGGHWERTEKGLKSIDYEHKKSTKLTSLLSLLGNDHCINPYGFDLLRKHIQTTLQVSKNNNLKEEFARLNLSAEQIYFYIKALTVLPKDIAAALMGEHLTEETVHFIETYVPILQIREPIYEQWFRARPENKPRLMRQEAEVIEQLLIPPKPIMQPAIQKPEPIPHLTNGIAEQTLINNQRELAIHAMNTIKELATNAATLDLLGNNQNMKILLLDQIRSKQHAFSNLNDNNITQDFNNMIAKSIVYIEHQAKAQQVQKILDIFKEKIKDIGDYHKEAQTQALLLQKKLQQLKNNVFKESSFETPIAEVKFLQLIKQTKIAIQEVIPTLQRDLGWGDYLANIAKQIANALTTAVSFGYHHGFFTITKSNSVTTATAMDSEIEMALIVK